MATKYKAPPVGRAYDYATGKLVNSTVSLYNPLGGIDPELMRQWHLKQLGDIGAVWGDFTGKGVSVGVYDEGTQATHWDLDDNYDASKHVVIDGKALDGSITTGAHGIAVAGLIAAERNGRGGVGVAYDAELTGVNIFDSASPINVNGENAAAFLSAIRQSSQFDVANHSWGSAGGYGTGNSRGNPDSGNARLSAAFGYAADVGRDGLGTITVMAAGNSATLGLDNPGVTDRHVIAVGAYRQADGVASFYSNHGPHLLVSAPSNDFAQLNGTGLVTTDLLGSAGYNWSVDPSAPNDYTDSFGGTSGATPIVSGVVALMLDANENLGWRDVQNILAASAKMPVAFDTGQVAMDVSLPGRVGTVAMNESRFALAGKAANWNGGAMHYSNDYGYGAVDAYNAVRMAEVWGLFGGAKTSANEVRATVERDVGLTASSDDPLLTSLIMPSNRGLLGTPKTFTFEMDKNINVERIDLDLNYIFKTLVIFQGTQIQEYAFNLMRSQMKLTAPDGTSSLVAFNDRWNFVSGGDQEYTFAFTGFHGVESKGTWTLDFSALDEVLSATATWDNQWTINSLKMDVYGSEVTNDDVYTYTNEFFDMLAIKGESTRRTLNDTDGGTDWINAAAVSTDVKLSLIGGQSTSFDGEKAFTIGRSSLIEGAVTGDGNDTLVGNKLDNLLFGMRGNDTLNGGAGNDTLFGGTGMDKFLFDNRGTSGKDTVLDWSGGDMIATQTALRGQAGNGTVTVAKSAMLLLDGLLSGDTVTLSQNGGAVLQAQGQKDGYFWYSYVSGADLDPNDVIREVSFQPERTAAGEVASSSSSTAASFADVATTFAAPANDQGAFYLYDAMAGSMSNGVLLHA
ncbi:S8 family serine peptidase [Sphingomonas sp.]|uniref:S8 family serine peptidase n=1 Tax=Sphingomonas sp. TaxID=28214 RepID=UPI0035B0B735